MAKFLAQESGFFAFPLREKMVSLSRAPGQTIFCLQEEKEVKKVPEKKNEEDFLLVVTEGVGKHLGSKKADSIVGFDKSADVFATDLKRRKESTNFKLNLDGKTIPIWLKGGWSRAEVLSVLLVVSACFEAGGSILRLTQALKDFDKEGR